MALLSGWTNIVIESCTRFCCDVALALRPRESASSCTITCKNRAVTVKHVRCLSTSGSVYSCRCQEWSPKCCRIEQKTFKLKITSLPCLSRTKIIWRDKSHISICFIHAMLHVVPSIRTNYCASSQGMVTVRYRATSSPLLILPKPLGEGPRDVIHARWLSKSWANRRKRQVVVSATIMETSIFLALKATTCTERAFNDIPSLTTT